MSIYVAANNGFGNGRGNGKEISRLLAAAVINQGFCKLLLSSPGKALADGFNGEKFRLPEEETRRVMAIRARSLADFARQLTYESCHRV